MKLEDPERLGGSTPNGTLSAVKFDESAVKETAKPKPKSKKPPKPNYAKIHAKPLPFDIHPLPALIPQSPLSLLRIAYVVLKDLFSPPRSLPAELYTGSFSSETHSIHITDPAHVRALWEMGFFGKGTLSRSEPTWLDRERARRIAGAGGTSEEATRKRREERKLFKLERARLEREQIEEQLRQETLAMNASQETQDTIIQQPMTISSKLDEESPGLSHVFPWAAANERQEERLSEQKLDEHFELNGYIVAEETKPLLSSEQADDELDQLPTVVSASQEKEPDVSAEDKEEKEILDPQVDVNEEHLQLTLEEAFFLTYGLAVLQVFDGSQRQVEETRSPQSSSSMTTRQLFELCTTHSTFPHSQPTAVRPDNKFLTHYAVYHHYRSLGWVVRPGVKFSVDFMLYNRGPVISHAEFAVMIIPEYSPTSPYAPASGNKDWWWLHCINRVQSQVRKSLVLAYVKVPDRVDIRGDGKVDIGAILRQYEVRDFVLRRWSPNRSRD